jgi:PhnB protein
VVLAIDQPHRTSLLPGPPDTGDLPALRRRAQASSAIEPSPKGEPSPGAQRGIDMTRRRARGNRGAPPTRVLHNRSEKEGFMAVNPIPEGFHTITPHLSIEGAAKAIDFYKSAFDAKEIMRAPDPSGSKIWHSTLQIGNSMLFVNDVFPEMGMDAKSASSVWLYVPDVDAWFKRAVDAGATPKMPPVDCFWGDRMGIVADPFGQTWTLATHVKDLTPEEMQKAQEEAIAQMKSGG